MGNSKRPSDDEIAEEAVEQGKVDVQAKLSVNPEGVQVLHPGDPGYPEAPKESDDAEAR